MNCADARSTILEADLADLRETGDSALNKHIRLCPACRALAERILQGELALRRALGAVRPQVDLDRVVTPVGGSPPRSRKLWTRAVPALAAAGLAGLVLSQIPMVRDHAGPVGHVPIEALPPTPTVEPPPGRSVVVFETDDRDIVIIWFY